MPEGFAPLRFGLIVMTRSQTLAVRPICKSGIRSLPFSGRTLNGLMACNRLMEAAMLGNSSPKIKPLCSVCGGEQFETPGGLSCNNGHGGADSVETT